MFILFISEKSPWNFPCFKPMTSHWNPLKPMKIPWISHELHLYVLVRHISDRSVGSRGFEIELGKTMEKLVAKWNMAIDFVDLPMNSLEKWWCSSSFFVCLPDGNTVGKRTVVLQVIQVSRKTWPCRISRRKPPACSSWQTFTRPGTKCGVDYHSHTPW